MFANYSTRARQIVFLARLKAGQRGAPELEIEDLLAAFIIEDQGGLHEAVSDFHGFPEPAPHVDPSPRRSYLPTQLARDLLERVGSLSALSEPVSAASDMPISDAVKRAFASASRLRDELKQNRVEPLHLLAAIAEDDSSRAAQALREAGITREEVLKALPRTAAAPEDRPLAVEAQGPGSAVRSLRTSRALSLAGHRARARGLERVEIEDLLGALILEDQGRFLEALSAVPGVGIDYSSIKIEPHRPFLARDIADRLLSQLEGPCSQTKSLPPRARAPVSDEVKRAFAVADLLRQALQQGAIEPLHLLAAVVGAVPSEAARLFLDAGITPEKMFESLRGEPT